eukprot:CAMPEP_0179019758 /NCGR_PEP_ID=MMETSP0796-20121207/5035_1 /TAXON_ID=73915 /ORGANISM="Pyrodinium bahamense, Strain pbaha01" /LENGTH=48 /DNA_ID= /DNA_START= /DNA_END= /DNA_ORIENTATION=
MNVELLEVSEVLLLTEAERELLDDGSESGVFLRIATQPSGVPCGRGLM